LTIRAVIGASSTLQIFIVDHLLCKISNVIDNYGNIFTGLALVAKRSYASSTVRMASCALMIALNGSVLPKSVGAGTRAGPIVPINNSNCIHI